MIFSAVTLSSDISSNSEVYDKGQKNNARGGAFATDHSANFRSSIPHSANSQQALAERRLNEHRCMRVRIGITNDDKNVRRNGL